MKASLYNFKQSPRKVRLVADMIRGKRVAVARDTLHFLPKKSAPELKKLLESAIANARTQGMDPEHLVVKKITVDKGLVMRRFKPMARGRAAGIRRTMSIVNLELGATNMPIAKKEIALDAHSEKVEKKTATRKPRAKKVTTSK